MPDSRPIKAEPTEAMNEAGDDETDATPAKPNPLDALYDKLSSKIKPVSVDSAEYEMIERYVANTHATTHNQYTATSTLFWDHVTLSSQLSALRHPYL